MEGASRRHCSALHGAPHAMPLAVHAAPHHWGPGPGQCSAVLCNGPTMAHAHKRQSHTQRHSMWPLPGARSYPPSLHLHCAALHCAALHAPRMILQRWAWRTSAGGSSAGEACAGGWPAAAASLSSSLYAATRSADSTCGGGGGGNSIEWHGKVGPAVHAMLKPTMAACCTCDVRCGSVTAAPAAPSKRLPLRQMPPPVMHYHLPACAAAAWPVAAALARRPLALALALGQRRPCAAQRHQPTASARRGVGAAPPPPHHHSAASPAARSKASSAASSAAQPPAQPRRTPCSLAWPLHPAAAVRHKPPLPLLSASCPCPCPCLRRAPGHAPLLRPPAR